MTLTAIEQSLFNFVIANKNSYDGKLYTGMRDLLVNPTPLKLMDKQNKDKIFHFLAKFVSHLYGTCTIAKWMSKKQGDSFIDMITMSDIAYTIAVVANSYEYWDQCYELKNMSNKDRESHVTRDEYTEKSPLFTSPARRQRKYCGSGWSDEGVEFFNKVWMQWKTISTENRHDVCTLLEKDWVEYAEENKFGCMTYNRTKKTPKDNSRISSPGTGVQDLPANRFSLEGEEDFELDRPWKRNRDSDDNSNNSTSDREDKRINRKRIHRVSNDSVAGSEEYDNEADDDEEDDGENDGEYKGV